MKKLLFLSILLLAPSVASAQYPTVVYRQPNYWQPNYGYGYHQNPVWRHNWVGPSYFPGNWGYGGNVYYNTNQNYNYGVKNIYAPRYGW